MKTTSRRDRFPKKPAKSVGKRKQSPAGPPTLNELFAPFIGAIKDGPADLAANHDHYAHGAPKRFK